MRRAEFVLFMDQIVSDAPPERELHVFLDSYCGHKKMRGVARATSHRALPLQPYPASWFNQIGNLSEVAHYRHSVSIAAAHHGRYNARKHLSGVSSYITHHIASRVLRRFQLKDSRDQDLRPWFPLLRQLQNRYALSPRKTQISPAIILE